VPRASAWSGSGGGDATSVIYSPTVPGDWSPVPTEVAEALDQAAARLKSLEAAAPTTLEVAGSALAIGTSVYRASPSGKMLAEDASYNALRDAFAGLTTSAAAANNDPVDVAGNGGRATGLTSIIAGVGYYVSAGVLIAETDLATFISLSVSGTWFRFLGTGDSTTSIKQAWGEPQQVP